MSADPYYCGSGLSAVDEAGGMRLPAFVRDTAIGRSGGRRLVFTAHESDPCLIGFDPEYAASLHAELERRRLADEAAGAAAEAHHGRARRAFGLAEDTQFDAGGLVSLSALLRRIGRIGALALFVGTGRTFEIWDPWIAGESGGDDLRALAAYRLEARESAGEEERE